MTGTKTAEYRQLVIESSNRLMEHDAARALGRYEEAARHARQAGELRTRMGRACFEAADFPCAVEDWLSAAACFLLAGAKDEADAALDGVRRMAAAGELPSERADLFSALQEREQELAASRTGNHRVNGQARSSAAESQSPHRERDA